MLTFPRTLLSDYIAASQPPYHFLAGVASCLFYHTTESAPYKYADSGRDFRHIQKAAGGENFPLTPAPLPEGEG